MGYTQGVNFVVGYLLLIGYSETDTFWLFAHLAMNRGYLLLGLYEDGFPLANIFTLIFKKTLSRFLLLLFHVLSRSDSSHQTHLHHFQILPSQILPSRNSLQVRKVFQVGRLARGRCGAECCRRAVSLPFPALLFFLFVFHLGCRRRPPKARNHTFLDEARGCTIRAKPCLAVLRDRR